MSSVANVWHFYSYFYIFQVLGLHYETKHSSCLKFSFKIHVTEINVIILVCLWRSFAQWHIYLTHWFTSFQIIIAIWDWSYIPLYPRHWNTGLLSSRVSLTSWGEGASLALVGHPFSDGVMIKIPYGVDVLLRQPAS